MGGRNDMRRATIERNTQETRIAATVDLDGSGTYEVSTGIGFLDHMLEQLSRHSLIDISSITLGDFGNHLTVRGVDGGEGRARGSIGPLVANPQSVPDSFAHGFLIWGIETGSGMSSGPRSFVDAR